eukprot:CAMPEP_0114173700 /NCGR_PEP_ID=MMETSP0043_2-20121206/35986_1 /TAXON_ID=464988 /ORGANISM="Hemiselmis andersenii, Strain CCMP644" /LENGTH=48 /DNA_ID= /DNA_START= /DNA_END= /DNA_ORIENTATION=
MEALEDVAGGLPEADVELGRLGVAVDRPRAPLEEVDALSPQPRIETIA